CFYLFINNRGCIGFLLINILGGCIDISLINNLGCISYKKFHDFLFINGFGIVFSFVNNFAGVFTILVHLSIDMSIINSLNKNVFINVKPPNVPKQSFASNYFSHLYKKPNEPLDTERVYCNICLEKLKNEQPDVSFASVKKLIGIYRYTSGTGNMKNHLLAMHHVTESQQTKTTNQHILSMFSRDRCTTKSSQLKQQLGHQLALMCCRDLLPFSNVENEVVSSKSEILSRTTLSPVNLNKIYDVCYQKTKELLKSSIRFPTITCDMWCDKYKHRSYICFTVHFLDSNLQYHHYSMKTQPFDESHADEAIKNLFLTVLHEFDADVASSYIDFEDFEALNENMINNDLEESWLSNDLQSNAKQIQCSTKSNSLMSMNKTDPDRFHTLKKRVLTRWNTILIMLRSYIENISGIEVLLRRLKHFDLILSVAENRIIYDLVEFLGLLESATTILSASKSYTTMNLYLLLRMKIESMLHITEMESPVIQELKILLFENLNKRYPVISLNMCAFLLDPSQLKIDITRYLTQNQTTKELTLLEMIKKFRIHYVPQESTTENISTPATSSHSTARTTTSSSHMKRNLSVENLSQPVQNLKKLRENLIQKHTPSTMSAADPIINEIEKYLKLDVKCDDVLEFWRLSGDMFPHLKRLAQIVLAIPATSTPSEQVFSTTGLILNAKRTMLLPENVGKIQMIHDNYSLFKPI
ncbi:unnamed protein product, partial [Rotaria sp. Silwood2]